MSFELRSKEILPRHAVVIGAERARTRFRKVASAYISRQRPDHVRGQPDELIGPRLLLCSPAGAWITGQVLHIDGGWVLRP